MQSTSTLYKFSLFALSPLALAHVIHRSLKDGGLRYFKQRLGFSFTKSKQETIHFHCASVGEFLTAKPLILKLQNSYPDKKVIISSNTPTAAALINELDHPQIQHQYFPIDFTFSVKRFFKHIQPICCIIVETEIWPNFYYQAAKHNIPITIINARLSKKTLNANKFIKNEYARTLKNVDEVLARSKVDHDNYLSLGAKPDTTQTYGNLKYSISDAGHEQLACTTLKRPFFLAASTHEDEEVQLSQHIELLKRKDYLLVIAPRYPDRCKQLAAHFKNQGLEVAIRSQHDNIDSTTDLYIIDTLGELDMYFNEAALVFIGGSLISRGGHNILEPASHGKCILVGPHTDNFSSEVTELLNAKALIQVKDNHQLGVQLIQLLKNDLQREQYGENAAKFMSKQAGLLDRYHARISKIIDNVNS